MTTRYERMAAILDQVFKPLHLEILDESAKHASHIRHTGAPAGGESHYNLVMVSPVFEGQSRVARARAVHEALAPEFKTGLHALALKLQTPAEVL